MERKLQTGYLVLADISGYTSFVAQTEIEHAGMAISILLEAIVEKLNSLLTINKLEGDAVCAYLDENQLPGSAALLDLIDQTYLTFRDRAAALQQQATCPCKACVAITMLDLKFIIHHGQFFCQNIAGIRDILGTDVNLAHRLMKNNVTEITGWKGYALFTQSSLEHLQTDKAAFVRQTESYDHLGKVDIYVRDMHIRYDEMKAR